HPDAYAIARARGFCRSAREFSFARCFGRELFTIVGGARVRAARTRMGLSKSPRSPADAGPSREGRSKSPRSPADAGPSREGRSKRPRSRADAGPSREGRSKSPRSPADAGPSREGRSKSPRSPADAGPSREGVASGLVDAHTLAATLRDHAGTE